MLYLYFTACKKVCDRLIEAIERGGGVDLLSGVESEVCLLIAIVLYDVH